MTDEERDIITRFIQRVSGASPAVPGGPLPAALPPVDLEADRLIGDLFAHYPEARYRLAQTAFVQEAAIREVQARIRALEAELQTTRDALQAARSSHAVPAQRSSFFGGFGGGAQPAPASMAPAGPQPNPWGPSAAPGYPQQPPAYPQPPQYAPQAQPGMMPRAGSGFLGSALTTAAGVAGGLVAGNALMGLFSGHGGGSGGGFGGGNFGQAGQPMNETVINNYGDSAYPDQAGLPPPDPGYTPWGEAPDASGSQALNDGYWSKDSIYQPDVGGADPGDMSDTASNDFSDNSDMV